MNTFSDYGLLALLLLAGIVMGAVPVLIPLLIAPRYRGKKSRDIYECGVDTIGSAWVRFGMAFYLFALIFVAFEVDVLYLFPVSLVFGSPQYVWRDLIEVSLFVGVLGLALLYAWQKGVFRAGEPPRRVVRGTGQSGWPGAPGVRDFRAGSSTRLAAAAADAADAKTPGQAE